MSKKLTLKCLPILITALLISCPCIANAEDSQPTTQTAVQSNGPVIHNYIDGGSVNVVNADACVLMDADSGTILYEKNPDKRLYPASITKILTTYIACITSKPDELVTYSDRAINGIGWDSSRYGMQVGETSTMDAALHTIMMFSANEVCMGVAEHIDGSVEKFMERVNKQLADWGCTGTHFTNPHGYHDDNHYTTARDMATITYHAVQNQQFNDIWGCVRYNMPATNKEPAKIITTKVMNLRPDSRYYYQYAKGAKTGFHDQALNTLVTYGVKDNMRLIAVVMKDGGRDKAYEDCQKLIDYGFLHFSDITLYNGDYTSSMQVSQMIGDEEFKAGDVTLTAPESITKHMPEFVDSSAAEISAELPEKLTAPITEGDKIGKLNISYNGNIVGSVDILAGNTVLTRPESELKLEKYKRIFTNEKNRPLIIIGSCIIGFGILLIFVSAVIASERRRKRKKRRMRNRYSNYDSKRRRKR